MDAVRLDRSGYQLEVEDTFDGPDLDPQRWIPHYLPQWSSREQSAARYRLRGGHLELLIEHDQPPWAPEWNGPLRTSSLQTGVRSGPMGSGDGQHRFADGLVVREAQTERRLYTPQYGLFECRARAIANPVNMVALWMIGFEDAPERSAELCIFEIFGRDIAPDRVRIGMGVHPFGDSTIRDEFAQVPVAIDAREPHVYAAEWTPDRIRFFVDDVLVKTVDQSPAYPMQLMLDVFEFADGDDPPDPPDRYPKVFEVDWFRGWRRG